MSKNSTIPDAWDDDYETAIAQKTTNTAAQPTPRPRTTRAERKATHAAENKQLWDSAENPEPFHFVETRRAIPLTTEFKPTLQVLSRKPKPPASTTDLASGVSALTLGEDEDDDSEEEARKAAEKGLAARQLRAKLEREEKQRKYAEARARLFGPGAESNGGRPPSPAEGSTVRTQQSRRGGRRGGGGTPGSVGRDPHSHSASSADQSPARDPRPARQLYDPDMRPGSVLIQKRGGAIPGGTPRSESTIQIQPKRLPKGPDGSGRGGSGFAPRGNRTGNTT